MALKYAVKSGNWSGSDVWGIKLTGTVSFTNGSTSVMGSGTAFTSELSAGDKIFGADGNWYEVASITDDTNLTLSSAYAGSDVSGVESYKQTSYPVEGDNARIKSNITVYGESGDWVVGDDTGDALYFEQDAAFEINNSDLTTDSTYTFKGTIKFYGRGHISIGSEADPISGKTVTFKLNYSSSLASSKYCIYTESNDVNQYIEAFGKARTEVTTLTSAVAVNDTTIYVSDATGWEVGDELVLVTTANRGESEKVTISSISGTTIGLSSGAQYAHDLGGYVLNITRNVVFTAYDVSYTTKWQRHRRGDLKNVKLMGFGSDDKGYRYVSQTKSDGSAGVILDGVVFERCIRPWFEGVSYPVLKDIIFYDCECGFNEYNSANSYHEGYIDGFFFCKRHSYTGGWVVDFLANISVTNVRICDLTANEVCHFKGASRVENVEVWALDGGNYEIFFGGTYVKNVKLGKFSATISSHYRAFDDETSWIIDGITLASSYVSSGGYIYSPRYRYHFAQINEGSGFYNKVAYGDWGNSSVVGVAGRNGTGFCLYMNPTSTSSYLTIPVVTDAFLHYLSHNFQFPVNSGKTITLSFWVKVSTSGFDGDLQIAAEGCGINYSWTSVDLTGADSDWVQRSFTLGTTTDKGFVRLKIRAKDGATVSGDIYLDDFAITES